MVTGVGGWEQTEEEGEENRRYRLPVMKQIGHGDAMYSLRKASI